jgi:hypoxanthine phosphoribosyltransferase
MAGRASFQKALGCSDRHGGPTDSSESETGVIAGMTLGADVLIPASDIQEKVREIGARINEDYSGKKPLLVGILRGAVVVLADLMRNVELACEIDFMEVGSYGLGSTSSGVVRILKDLQEDITGRHVLIVEDIIDTGLTMSYLHDLLLTRKPASLESFVLLSKPSRRQVDIDVKYVGFEVPDVFVVGYGIDYAGAYRNLPDILALESEAASE